jgi:hypothetical protein
MFWPFKRRERAEQPANQTDAAPDELDIYDRAAENLIAQGVDPAKVRRATALVKRMAREGGLPEGTVEREE